MSLEGEHVATAFEMLKGTMVGSQDANRLSALFGNRQELLAFLILQEGCFKLWPQISIALRAAASAAHVVSRTPRPEVGDGIGSREAALKAAIAIDGLLASERSRSTATDATHDAINEIVNYWGDRARHPGYHWCVRNEPLR